MLAWSCERNSYTLVSTYLRQHIPAHAPTSSGTYHLQRARGTMQHITGNVPRTTYMSVHVPARAYEVPVTSGTCRHYSLVTALPCPTVLLVAPTVLLRSASTFPAPSRGARSFPREAARSRVGAECLLMDTRTRIRAMRTLGSMMSALHERLLFVRGRGLTP